MNIILFSNPDNPGLKKSLAKAKEPIADFSFCTLPASSIRHFKFIAKPESLGVCIEYL
jgi:hypothetical protein